MVGAVCGVLGLGLSAYGVLRIQQTEPPTISITGSTFTGPVTEAAQQQVRALPQPGAVRSRVFGSIPHRAWRWQPRPREERAVRRALGRHGQAALVALPGARGVGKSQLAAGYVRLCLDRGYDLVAWINAESGLLPELFALATHLELPGAAEMTPKGAAAAVRRWLEQDSRARRLLVFDNADDPEALRLYLPAVGSAKVLITTNRQEVTAMGGTGVVAVRTFTSAEGMAFLTRATGLSPSDDGMRLGELLGWLPLGLAQAAAFIARTGATYTEYATLLQGQNLDELLRQRAGADHPGVLKATRLALSRLAKVDGGHDAVRLLNVLSLLSPDGMSLGLLVSAEPQLGLHGGMWAAVGALVDASLATIGGDSRKYAGGVDRRVIAVHRLTASVVRHEFGAASGGNGPAVVNTSARVLEALTNRFPRDQVALRRDELDEIAAHLDAVLSNTDDPSHLLLEQINRIALLLRDAGDLTRALVLFRQNLTACERVLGAEHPDTLGCRVNFASTLREAGRPDQAIPMLEQALAESRRLVGFKELDRLIFQSNLASAYRLAGRLNEAVAIGDRTLADQQRLFGPVHRDTLNSCNDLASAYCSIGRFDEAIALSEETIGACESALGSEHSQTLRSRVNLAFIYRCSGRLSVAIPLYLKNIALLKRVLGEDHPDTLNAHNGLAIAYCSAGRVTEAHMLFVETLAARERVSGADHPDTLNLRNNLAIAYSLAGRPGKAMALHEETLVARERVLGVDHLDTLRSRNNLAIAYCGMGRVHEAIDLHQQTLFDQQRILGFEHPDALNSSNNLANALRSAGRMTDAIALCERTLAACEQVLGSAYPLTETVRGNLEDMRCRRSARE
ncbi:tetratricopeptide repeat protein [Amycolatopsis sp. NPDC051758]|uniref:tetratricopeptide repeat protein n=1 Tax=Amycolatopsis sp. NPDC051758 TaxID=3363935 RepID=UPI0037975C93